MDGTLLPYNASQFSLAMEGATARIGDVPLPIRDVWNIQTCPVELLPWLAWTFNVPEWDSGWPEQVQRAFIAASIPNHRIKGTPASIKNILAAAGYPGATIQEGAGSWKLDGATKLDGSRYLGDTTKWAWYRVTLPTPISIDQAKQVIRLLNATAPARCYLESLDFTQAAFRLNGAVKLNGEYTLGTVTQ